MNELKLNSFLDHLPRFNLNCQKKKKKKKKKK